jgi:hypothetical protein
MNLKAFGLDMCKQVNGGGRKAMECFHARDESNNTSPVDKPTAPRLTKTRCFPSGRNIFDLTGPRRLDVSPVESLGVTVDFDARTSEYAKIDQLFP